MILRKISKYYNKAEEAITSLDHLTHKYLMKIHVLIWQLKLSNKCSG